MAFLLASENIFKLNSGFGCTVFSRLAFRHAEDFVCVFFKRDIATHFDCSNFDSCSARHGYQSASIGLDLSGFGR
jgi:hypothetical protein